MNNNLFDMNNKINIDNSINDDICQTFLIKRKVKTRGQNCKMGMSHMTPLLSNGASCEKKKENKGRGPLQ